MPGRPRQNPQAPDRYPTFVATGFRDLLLAAGVTEAQFRQMTVHNPARLHGGAVICR